jgi:hypothetical protein
MTEANLIGTHVAQITAEVAATLPAGTTLDLNALRLELPHDAGSVEIEQTIRAALAQEAAS